MAKGFYVTVQRTAPAGVKTGWLLGPYPDKEAAEGHVARARNDMEPWQRQQARRRRNAINAACNALPRATRA